MDGRTLVGSRIERGMLISPAFTRESRTGTVPRAQKSFSVQAMRRPKRLLASKIDSLGQQPAKSLDFMLSYSRSTACGHAAIAVPRGADLGLRPLQTLIQGAELQLSWPLPCQIRPLNIPALHRRLR